MIKLRFSFLLIVTISCSKEQPKNYSSEIPINAVEQKETLQSLESLKNKNLTVLQLENEMEMIKLQENDARIDFQNSGALSLIDIFLDYVTDYKLSNEKLDQSNFEISTVRLATLESEKKKSLIELIESKIFFYNSISQSALNNNWDKFYSNVVDDRTNSMNILIGILSGSKSSSKIFPISSIHLILDYFSPLINRVLILDSEEFNPEVIENSIYRSASHYTKNIYFADADRNNIVAFAQYRVDQLRLLIEKINGKDAEEDAFKINGLIAMVSNWLIYCAEAPEVEQEQKNVYLNSDKNLKLEILKSGWKISRISEKRGNLSLTNAGKAGKVLLDIDYKPKKIDIDIPSGKTIDYAPILKNRLDFNVAKIADYKSRLKILDDQIVDAKKIGKSKIEGLNKQLAALESARPKVEKRLGDLKKQSDSLNDQAKNYLKKANEYKPGTANYKFYRDKAKQSLQTKKLYDGQIDSLKIRYDGQKVLLKKNKQKILADINDLRTKRTNLEDNKTAFEAEAMGYYTNFVRNIDNEIASLATRQKRIDKIRSVKGNSLSPSQTKRLAEIEDITMQQRRILQQNRDQIINTDMGRIISSW